jgi:predicted lysophospholipase L1 biosynthesis ABC-type transport system permease subunit
MGMSDVSAQPPRQITLPLSKAIEIAWKSIRLRLSRSLVVTSGIVLALAFLISILANNALIGAMRQRVQSVSSPDTQKLESLMKSRGVPMTEQDISNDRIQTHWLLGLALLVAFVGILNAMLMSVTERFREIGTMKCLGALDGFIIRLFLLESLFQGVVGTILGITIGLGLSLLNASLSYGRFAWQNVPVHELAMATLFCFAVGIGLTVAGAVYPALQAARMQPIAAMRVEA